MMVEHNQSANNPTNGGYNNAYKFNGKELDDATGMYYYGARYYDPRISIFVSVDPLAEQTMEPYLYTGNNPIMFTDPTGMSKDDWYKDKNGNFIYDSELTKNNSSYRLSKDEKYVGESVKISVDKYGENPGTINLSKSGEISQEGKRFLSGNVSRSVSNDVVEVDFNLKNNIKIYGTQNNPSFSGNAKDQYEFNIAKGIDKEIKRMDIEIRNLSYEIKIVTINIKF